jgi:hypothetical protein
MLTALHLCQQQRGHPVGLHWLRLLRLLGWESRRGMPAAAVGEVLPARRM